jgi:hypothetical protein
MSDEINLFDPDRSDDDATRALRALYAAPQDPTYWDGLHARVMAYVVASEAAGWWTGFTSWSRLAAVAAAVALIVIGIGAQSDSDAETRASYESILEDTAPASTYERVTRTAGLSESEAIFRYVVATEPDRS